MRSGARVTIVAGLTFAVWLAGPAAAPRRTVPPPPDAAASDAGLARVRDALREAARLEKVELLRPILAPQVFYPEPLTADSFLTQVAAEARAGDRSLWREVKDALAHPVAIDGDTAHAPYLALVELPTFDSIVIAGRGVRVRDRPVVDARVIDVLSYDVVEPDLSLPASSGVVTLDGEAYEWVPIITASGRTGWVPGKYVWKTLAFRVIFTRIAGEWKVAGLTAPD